MLPAPATCCGAPGSGGAEEPVHDEGDPGHIPHILQNAQQQEQDQQLRHEPQHRPYTLVSLSAYFTGAAAVVLSGILLKKCRIFAGEPAPFVMELPAYHAPSPGKVPTAAFQAISPFQPSG